jgi:hypothetical protein
MKRVVPLLTLCVDCDQTIKLCGEQSVPYGTAWHHEGQGKSSKYYFSCRKKCKKPATIAIFLLACALLAKPGMLA